MAGRCETVDKALDAAAFVIDGDDKFGRAQGFDVAAELFQLFDILEVAAEQNHATDGRVEQALDVVFA